MPNAVLDNRRPTKDSEVRLEVEGVELVRELAIEGRYSVVSVCVRERNDRSVGEAGKRIGPELQHAAPRTVIDDLHAGELGDGVDDRGGPPRCQTVLALQDVHDLEDDGLRYDAGDLAFFRGAEQRERGFLLRFVSLDEEGDEDVRVGD